MEEKKISFTNMKLINMSGLRNNDKNKNEKNIK